MRIPMIAATLLLTFALNTHAKILLMDYEDLRTLKAGSFSKLETLMNMSKPLPKTAHKLKTKVQKKKAAHKTKKAHKIKKTSHKASEADIRRKGYVVGNMNEIRSELDYCIQSVHYETFLTVGQNDNGNIFRSASSCNDDSAFNFSRTVPGQNRWKIRSLKNLQFLAVDQFSSKFQMVNTRQRQFTSRQVWIPTFLNSTDQSRKHFRISNFANGGNLAIGNGQLNPKWQMITYTPNTATGQKFRIIVR